MGHLIVYNLKVLLGNRSLVFWTIAFPILLGILFKVALGDIINKAAFEPVPVAVVTSQAYDSSAFKSAFAQLEDPQSDQQMLEIHEVATLEEGKKLLTEEKVAGVVQITGQLETREAFGDEPPTHYTKDARAKLVIASNGMNQTILKIILDAITQQSDMITKTIESEITSQAASGNPAFNPMEIATKVQDELTEKGFELQDRSPKSMDILMVEFFSLVAMAALYGGMFSMTILNNAQPPLGVIGRRNAVAPTSKGKLLWGGIITSYLVQLVGLVFLLVMCRFVFGIDFGQDPGLTFLLITVGALSGLAFGAVVSTLIPGGENAKVGTLIALTMLGAVLAGMMGATMRYQVDQSMPLVNKLNPVALITDGFYNLYYHPGAQGYWQDIVLLVVISAVLLGASAFVLRRMRYDSL